MKKYLSLILVLFLFVCCTAFASAEFKVELAAQLDNTAYGDISYSTFSIWDRSTNLCYIYDDNLVPSKTGYVYLYRIFEAREEGYDLYEAALDEGINNKGYVTGDGTVVVPFDYYNLMYLSSRWQVGIHVEKCEASLEDYRDYMDGNSYRILYNDFYYMGNKVLTLQRVDHYVSYAYGDYLIVKDFEGNYTAYNKNGNISTNNTIENGLEYLDKFDEHQIIHQPTGQIAFDSTCTLTPDEVKNDLYITSTGYYDLQGKRAIPFQISYSSFGNFKGNYAPVEFSGKYGVIDRQGKEVIPCIFDRDLRLNFDATNEKFLGNYGYIPASIDGKFCFVNSKGEITYQSPYKPDVVKGLDGLIKYVQDLSGNYIVLTPEGGQTTEQFASIEATKGFYCIAKNLDGNLCVIDIFGNKILTGNSDTRSFNFTSNGKIIVENLGRTQNIYLVSGDFPNAEPPLAAEVKEDKILATLQKIAETAETPAFVLSETLLDRKAPEIEYDAQGRKTKETTFFPDGSIDKITSYKYDLIESRTEDFYADGKLVLSRVFFDSEIPTMELVFGYNEQGERTGIGTYTYDENGVLSAIIGASDQVDGVPWHRTFAINGNTVHSMLYDKDNTALSECLCVYDNAKNLLSENYIYYGGGRSEKIDYTYNTKGFLTNKAGTFIQKDSKIEITNTYEYDNSGNPVKETGYICSYSGSQKDGREASYEQIFEYDPAGTLLKTARRENNDNYRTITEYQYDSHGNVTTEKKYKLTDGAAENQVTAYELTEHSYEYDGDRIIRETVSGNEEKTISYISEGTAYIKSEGNFYDTFYEPDNDLPKYNISSFQSGNKNYAVYNMQYSPNPGSFDQCQCFWEGSGDVNIRYKPLEGLNTRIFLTFANGADCVPETDFGGVYVLF